MLSLSGGFLRAGDDLLSAPASPHFAFIQRIGPVMPDAGMAMWAEKPSRMALARVLETSITSSFSP